MDLHLPFTKKDSEEYVRMICKPRKISNNLVGFSNTDAKLSTVFNTQYWGDADDTVLWVSPCLTDFDTLQEWIYFEEPVSSDPGCDVETTSKILKLLTKVTHFTRSSRPKGRKVLRKIRDCMKDVYPESFERQEVINCVILIASKCNGLPQTRALHHGLLIRDTTCLPNAHPYAVFCNYAGAIAVELSEFHLALWFFTSALKVSQKGTTLDQSYDVLVAIIKNNVGCTQAMQGRCTDAHTSFNEAQQKLEGVTNFAARKTRHLMGAKEILRDIIAINRACVQLKEEQYAKAISTFEGLNRKYRALGKNGVVRRNYSTCGNGGNFSEMHSEISDEDQESGDENQEPCDQSTNLRDTDNYLSRDEVLSLLRGTIALNYVNTHYKLRNWAQCEEGIQDVFKYLSALPIEIQDSVKRLLYLRLGRVFIIQGKKEEAQSILEREMINAAKMKLFFVNGEYDSFKFAAIEESSRILCHRGEWCEARLLLDMAVEESRNELGICHVSTLSLLMTIGENFRAQDTEMAKTALRRVEEVTLHDFTDEHPVLLTCYVMLGTFDGPGATVYTRKASEIRKKFHHPDHTEKLEEMETKLQKLELAERFWMRYSFTAMEVDRAMSWSLCAKTLTVIHQTNKHPEVTLMDTLATKAAISDAQCTNDSASGLMFDQLRAIQASMDSISQSKAGKTSQNVFADDECCLAAAVCVLVTTALLRKDKESIFKTCNMLEEFLSSNEEQYININGLPISYFNRHVLRMRESDVVLCVIVTSSDVNQEAANKDTQPLFEIFSCNETKDVTTSNSCDKYFIFCLTKGILDVNELRKLDQSYLQTLEMSLVTSLRRTQDAGGSTEESASLLPQRSFQVIEVRPRLSSKDFRHHIELLPLCILAFLGDDAGSLPGSDPDLSQKVVSPYISHSRYKFNNDWESTTLYMLLVLRLRKHEGIVEDRMSNKECSFLFLSPSRGVVNVQQCNSHLYLRCSMMGSSDVIMQLVDHVMEDCSRDIKVEWTQSSADAWCAVANTECSKSMSELEETAGQRDPDNLKEEVRLLKEKIEQQEIEINEAKKLTKETLGRFAELEARLLLQSSTTAHFKTIGSQADSYCGLPCDQLTGVCAMVDRSEASAVTLHETEDNALNEELSPLITEEHRQTNSLSLEYGSEEVMIKESHQTEIGVQTAAGNYELSSVMLQEFGCAQFERDKAQRNLLKFQISMELENKRRERMSSSNTSLRSSASGNSNIPGNSISVSGLSSEITETESQTKLRATSHQNAKSKDDTEDESNVSNNVLDKELLSSSSPQEYLHPLLGDVSKEPETGVIQRQKVRALSRQGRSLISSQEIKSSRDNCVASRASFEPSKSQEEPPSPGANARTMPWPSLQVDRNNSQRLNEEPFCKSKETASDTAGGSPTPTRNSWRFPSLPGSSNVTARQEPPADEKVIYSDASCREIHENKDLEEHPTAAKEASSAIAKLKVEDELQLVEEKNDNEELRLHTTGIEDDMEDSMKECGISLRTTVKVSSLTKSLVTNVSFTEDDTEYKAKGKDMWSIKQDAAQDVDLSGAAEEIVTDCTDVSSVSSSTVTNMEDQKKPALDFVNQCFNHGMGYDKYREDIDVCDGPVSCYFDPKDRADSGDIVTAGDHIEDITDASEAIHGLDSSKQTDLISIVDPTNEKGSFSEKCVDNSIINVMLHLNSVKTEETLEGEDNPKYCQTGESSTSAASTLDINFINKCTEIIDQQMIEGYTLDRCNAQGIVGGDKISNLELQEEGNSRHSLVDTRRECKQDVARLLSLPPANSEKPQRDQASEEHQTGFGESVVADGEQNSGKRLISSCENHHGKRQDVSDGNINGLDFREEREQLECEVADCGAAVSSHVTTTHPPPSNDNRSLGNGYVIVGNTTHRVLETITEGSTSQLSISANQIKQTLNVTHTNGEDTHSLSSSSSSGSLNRHDPDTYQLQGARPKQPMHPNMDPPSGVSSSFLARHSHDASLVGPYIVTGLGHFLTPLGETQEGSRGDPNSFYSLPVNAKPLQHHGMAHTTYPLGRHHTLVHGMDASYGAPSLPVGTALKSSPISPLPPPPMASFAHYMSSPSPLVGPSVSFTSSSVTSAPPTAIRSGQPVSPMHIPSCHAFDNTTKSPLPLASKQKYWITGKVDKEQTTKSLGQFDEVTTCGQGSTALVDRTNPNSELGGPCVGQNLPQSPLPNQSCETTTALNTLSENKQCSSVPDSNEEVVVLAADAAQGFTDDLTNVKNSTNTDSMHSLSSLESYKTADEDSLKSLEETIASLCSTMGRFVKEREAHERLEQEAREREAQEREIRENEARERVARETERLLHDREARERAAREIAEAREERETREREELERRTRYREQKERENNGSEGAHPVPARLPVQESAIEWPCEHYKRKCHVKFPCCDVFYPCHRCHNSSGNCENTSAKALHSTHLQCRVCLTEQEINEDSHTCTNCNTKLSEYFCGICKHYTGMEKTPYHCQPCGICRIHKDRSFHCDVCNVCLDKRLRGKHKCRPDSGHDECCICLEDAFSGCQILPCSHKVHRDCALAMLRNGIRTCPVCRHPLHQQLDDNGGDSNHSAQGQNEEALINVPQ